MRASARHGVFDRVHTIVREIPRGRVMTYGQISELMDCGISPVAVGWALSSCPVDVPWHRVVNALGRCSTEGSRQQRRLEREGVVFDHGRLDLPSYRYRPR